MFVLAASLSSLSCGTPAVSEDPEPSPAVVDAAALDSTFVANKVAWARVVAPTSALPQPIGSYTSGCLAGGIMLPLDGPGYQVMRPTRHRFYGHPSLIAVIQRLGARAATQGSQILIGDLSQPRGGPMLFGHNSHQIGLDADIWLRRLPVGQLLSLNEREKMPLVSTVNVVAGDLRSEQWSPLYRDLLKFAAETPAIERIFVNPIIKQALCRTESNRTWLGKLRPWWGHDDHFHIRLRCPPSSSQCKGQKAVPPGDGCDAELAQWVHDIMFPKPRKPSGLPRPLVLPEQCQAVLNATR
ncbi:MAG: penicillin-insensitive murein endopeptidase [Gammaproteobacteria bacterium]